MTFFAPSLNLELMASLNICDLEGGWPLERSIPIVETKCKHSDPLRTKPVEPQRTFVFQYLSEIIHGSQRCGLVSEFLE